jgi:UDP-N-acetyl-2-amino-2-deoxyglucuronate dehydrogenase
LNVGIIGTGAIARMHARAYRNIGFRIVVCTDHSPAAGREFAAANGAEYVATTEDVCRHPAIDYVDVCTLPDYRLEPLRFAAAVGKPVQVEKPIATNLETACEMVETARRAGIQLGVVSQRRFDESSQFLSRALTEGRLGRLIQCDCYVKWYRSPEYYSRPIKGNWAVEGGGVLINQAIHQLDLLRWLVGPVAEVFGYWQLGSLHKIESEDVVSAVLRYANGATGVVQASTAFWPGYTERIEFHGTRGSAILSGDKLTNWDVKDDGGEPAPVAREVASGSSDPMAIPVEAFERQFLDFATAIRGGGAPKVSGEAGYQALELVDAVYRSCRSGHPVRLASA